MTSSRSQELWRVDTTVIFKEVESCLCNDAHIQCEVDMLLKAWHYSLQLQEHNERQLASWASFAVSPGQVQPH